MSAASERAYIGSDQRYNYRVQRVQRKLWGLGRWVLVIGVTLAMIFPVLWVLRVALMSDDQYARDPSRVGGAFTTSHFGAAWHGAHLEAGFWNSLLIVPFAAGLGTLLAGLAGFTLARLKPAGGKVIVPIIAASIAVPIPAILIPLFSIGLRVGYTDSRFGLIFVYSALFAGWGTLFMYAFYGSVPNALIEAARVEGAHNWQIVRSIGLPLGIPALGTVFMMNFLAGWSELLLALVMLPDRHTLTVSVALLSTEYVQGGPLTAAGLLIAAIPVSLVFLASQRFIQPGVLKGAVRG
jgi:ABC-type glycerol-3-phosphate transport system permease component